MNVGNKDYYYYTTERVKLFIFSRKCIKKMVDRFCRK